MLSSKQKLRVVSKATISTSEDDSSDGEVKKRISGQLVFIILFIQIYIVLIFKNMLILFSSSKNVRPSRSR